ncbi:hypothetical protein [Halorubrum kocurii]|uniref:hypothetical protein n=1 Tax=Halorubrum kocurii TaxID=478441 RepID=UPI0012693891|nr:hypothetical protein [Halorubrum kocurii]
MATIRVRSDAVPKNGSAGRAVADGSWAHVDPSHSSSLVRADASRADSPARADASRGDSGDDVRDGDRAQHGSDGGED